jgi:RNA polymerase primary sigma factor
MKTEDPMVVKKETPYSDDALQAYFDRIKRIPLLSAEEELELSRRIRRGDEAALHRLINANLRLVVKIARAYLTADMTFLDIIQEGNIGLMHAAKKYDHNKNVRFSTYAGWWIRQAISRFLSSKRRAIRLPHRKEETLRKIQKAYHTLSQSLMRRPSTGEVSREIGVSQGDVEFILNMTSSHLSLDTDPDREDAISVADLHEDYTYCPERALMRKSLKAETLRFLDRLKDRERRILTYRYQLDGCERHTLKTIGDKMGISPETVRQIEIRALRKIRSEATGLWDSLSMEAM